MPSRAPDLLTIIVEPSKDDSLKVTYVAEGPTPADSTGYVDMDALVDSVNAEVVDQYAKELGGRIMGLQYAWYPWGDQKPPKNSDLPKKFYLMFEIRASESGYTAALADSPSTAVAAATLRDLAQAAHDTAIQHWPVLADTGIPGMMHWNRELASGQLRDVTT